MEHRFTGRLYDLRKSFAHAFRGIAFCIRYERNMRIHIVITAYVLSFSRLFYEHSRVETVLLILTCALVMALEIVNTAIEVLTDKAAPEFSALARAAKDAAAGAVLLAAGAAVTVGGILFWDVAVFREIAAFFSEYPLLLVSLILTVILSGIFVFTGKKRRNRVVKKRADNGK